METPEPGVDVNPMTQQLQRRLQQRSVLYLMGPGRMMERVRQVPGLLVRLPRTLWDTVIRGKKRDDQRPRSRRSDRERRCRTSGRIWSTSSRSCRAGSTTRSASNPIAAKWLERADRSYATARLEPADAGNDRRRRTGRPARVAREALERHAARHAADHATAPPPARRAEARRVGRSRRRTCSR